MTRVTISTWSGREVRALREALRMTGDAFAARLGVSPRIVAKWEAGAIPGPQNQGNLDTALELADEQGRQRFAVLADIQPVNQPPTVEGQAESPRPALPDDTQRRHPRDGKLMTLVNEGVYLAGPSGDSPLWLDAFYIDVHPVTNAEYLRYLSANNRAAPEQWEQLDPHPKELPDHPVVFVDWHAANDYAAWADKTLPTAAQWEKAARGTRGEVYPWGSNQTPAKCNVRESSIRATTPVDRYHSGVSPYGVYDLCGNTWEWCSDKSAADRRALKGSAFTSPFHRATPSNFNDALTTMCDDDTGFRCITTPGGFN